MRYRELLRLISLIMAFVTLLSFSMFAPSALAADGAVSVEGKLYTFDEKEHYEITGTRYSGATNGKNT